MTRKDIEEIVKEFLIEDLEIDEENIRPEAHLKEEVGIDSLDFVDIVVIVERSSASRSSLKKWPGSPPCRSSATISKAR